MKIMHKPVMTDELINFLEVDKKTGVFVDCTGGGGGHSESIVNKLNSDSRLIIIDVDEEAVNILKEKFRHNQNVTIVKGNFRDVDKILAELGIRSVIGLFADLGMSTFQVKDPDRGFSFMNSGPLDMRMSKDIELTAYDIVNEFSKDSLKNIIYKFGEEKFAGRIVNLIVKKRAINKIVSTIQLANIVKEAVPAEYQRKTKLHPATKTFQALRIYINKELEALEELLKKLEYIIEPTGRAAFISFHSLEDRLIKEKFNYYEKECICPPRIVKCVCNKKKTFNVLTKKPVIPSDEEVKNNPMSRSAKLRVAERLK
ncbi:MAG: 16S rRNA (cytosine(1402)-N(4))-methyltransferase RsmH [Deferribacterota bacterium]|nr:16S rRNA (cytosine(1402)-N(4))-methyltransferase RsmH [Deferribacterota bacterium]